jgi:hypothetical protein
LENEEQKLIPFVQPIFIPDQNHYNLNKNSIISFANYIKKYPYNTKCYFIGWTASDEYWNNIENVIKNNLPSKIIYKIVRKKENFGKACVVNEALQDIKDLDFDYFLTCDSDIVFLESIPNMFERFLFITKKIKKEYDKDIGFIANEQKGMSGHVYKKLKDEYDIKGYLDTNESLIYCKKQPSYIAGGSIFVSKKAWFHIDGYRERSVYGGQDAFLLHDMRKKTYQCYVAKNIAVYHPKFKDENYQKYKFDINRKKLHNNTYDKLKKISDEFWKNNKNG